MISASIEVLQSGVVPSENLVKDDPKWLSILLLARTLSLAKGIRALVKVGRILEARILTRNCIENGFWVCRLIDGGDKFVREMVQDEQKRLTMRGHLLFEQRVEMDAEIEERLRGWLGERRHWQSSKALNPKEVAGAGSMDAAYIFYSELSADAHPGLHALNRYVSQDDGAEIELEPKIDPNEVLDTLHLHAFSLLTVLVAVNQMLGGGASDVLTKLTDEFQELERGLSAQ